MLGETLKEYRKLQNLTLKELAIRSNLSSGYISQLERGLVEPSINSLRKLAKILNVPITLLLDRQPTDDLTIRYEKHFLVRNNDDTVSYEILTPIPSAKFIPKSLMIKFTIQPHSTISETLLTHSSEEIIYVLSGELVVELANEDIILHPGDSTVLRDDIPHSCRNDSNEPTTGISCLSPPTWGQNGIGKL